MKTIIITEKPSVAQEYRKALRLSVNGKNDGYMEGYSDVLKKTVQITWAVGHLISLASVEQQNSDWGGAWKDNFKNLPMIPTSYKYIPQSETRKQFNVVKSLYLQKDVEAIYYAGDSGREGIYIQALIRNQVFKSAPKFVEKVVWIDSFTEEAILKGIREAKPYSAYENMIASGYLRAISDWLIGMNFTQGLTVACHNFINVGRVMTPTLAMIVKRQAEIDNFKEVKYFGIKADSFAYWKATEKSKFFESNLLYNETGFLNRKDCEDLLSELNKSKQLTVEESTVTEKKEYAPLLFNLADLQGYCSKCFKISPKSTLDIAQSLYEKKMITYPRTDSRYLTTSVAKDIKSRFGKTVPAKYVNDDKVTDHYALMPTFEKGSLSGLELSVYEAIVKRFEDIFKPPFIYDECKIVYLHKNGERFYATIKNVKQIGYKENEKLTNFPVPQKGTVVDVNSFAINEMETKPPVPYTTGTLILAMEKAGKLIDDEELREQIKTCGIGTSATRAGIIEKLADKKYILIDKGQKICPTDMGKSVIPIIAEMDATLISPEKTAMMEQKLQDVADGKTDRRECEQYVNNYICEIIGKIKGTTNLGVNIPRDISSYKSSSTSHACPCCGKELKHGKYGYYCECKFSLGNEICGHKMKESDLEDICKKGRTKLISFTSKAGKPFKAYLVLNQNERKTVFEFEKK